MKSERIYTILFVILVIVVAYVLVASAQKHWAIDEAQMLQEFYRRHAVHP